MHLVCGFNSRVLIGPRNRCVLYPTIYGGCLLKKCLFAIWERRFCWKWRKETKGYQIKYSTDRLTPSDHWSCDHWSFDHLGCICICGGKYMSNFMCWSANSTFLVFVMLDNILLTNVYHPRIHGHSTCYWTIGQRIDIWRVCMGNVSVFVLLYANYNMWYDQGVCVEGGGCSLI